MCFARIRLFYFLLQSVKGKYTCAQYITKVLVSPLLKGIIAAVTTRIAETKYVPTFLVPHCTGEIAANRADS